MQNPSLHRNQLQIDQDNDSSEIMNIHLEGVPASEPKKSYCEQSPQVHRLNASMFAMVLYCYRRIIKWTADFESLSILLLELCADSQQNPNMTFVRFGRLVINGLCRPTLLTRLVLAASSALQVGNVDCGLLARSSTV